MTDLWVIIPANDIRIQMPMSMTDRNVKLTFKDAETIDSVITQLENLKKTIRNTTKYFCIW